MRILVIEDYVPLRKNIVEALNEAGYVVDSTGTGDEGLWYATNHAYDTIVLDIMLPKVDGLTILKKLRKLADNTPVIIISARDAVDDRIQGLDCGADDYLIKPFALSELLARVRSRTRQRYGVKSTSIEIGDLTVNTLNKRVSINGQEVKLTSREYSLLEYLAMRSGEVVSRQDIWDHVYEYYEDASSNTVDVYVGYLRKKLKSFSPHSYIHTRRGQGYLLEYEEVVH
jgi:two-component system OmpR family response regulator